MDRSSVEPHLLLMKVTPLPTETLSTERPWAVGQGLRCFGILLQFEFTSSARISFKTTRVLFIYIYSLILTSYQNNNNDAKRVNQTHLD